MRIHFVTFATPAFRVRQWLLNISARWFGKADQLHVWTQAKLEQDGFIARQPELFQHSTGSANFTFSRQRLFLILKILFSRNRASSTLHSDPLVL